MNQNQFLPILEMFVLILPHYRGQRYYDRVQVTIMFQGTMDTTWFHPSLWNPAQFFWLMEELYLCAFGSPLLVFGGIQHWTEHHVYPWPGDKQLLLFKIITILGKLRQLWFDLFTLSKALCVLTSTDTSWTPTPTGHCSRYWRYHSSQDRIGPCPCRVSLTKKTQAISSLSEHMIKDHRVKRPGHGGRYGRALHLAGESGSMS